MLKTVILAGGKGTRLGNLTKNMPKSMVRIAGKPILEHQIEWLKKYGINEIIIITHYLSAIIEDYFKEGNNSDVKISYYKEVKPLGTTGGIKEIEHFLDKDFILLYGDIMLNLDLERLVEFHFKKKGVGTLVIHPNDHPVDSDLVEIDRENRIIQFHCKPHPVGRHYRNLANVGLYVLSPEIFRFVKKGLKQDFGSDLFLLLVNKVDLYGYKTAEYLKDIGTPSRLEEVTSDFLSGEINKLNRHLNKRRFS